jgi:hypothetical protein
LMLLLRQHSLQCLRGILRQFTEPEASVTGWRADSSHPVIKWRNNQHDNLSIIG